MFREQSMEKKSFSQLSCTELLQKFEEKEVLGLGKKLVFSGVGERDVYNISAPFRIGDMTVIAGRTEARDVLADSNIVFFEQKENTWTPIKDAPTFHLEDGFATHVGGETVFGGVEVYHNPDAIDPHEVNYRTVFYRGHDFPSLQKFATGPETMKDIRIISLANSRVGVFTRPQGGQYGKGKIGYIELQCLEDLNVENIMNARIIENQFTPEEWGGANQLHLLPDGKVGVIGHIAYQDKQGNKHYHAMSFIYDPKKHSASPVEIIATRKNFPSGAEKAPELADIVFPGGLVRHSDGTATLYAGLSDAEAGSIILPDPFSK